MTHLEQLICRQDAHAHRFVLECLRMPPTHTDNARPSRIGCFRFIGSRIVVRWLLAFRIFVHVLACMCCHNESASFRVRACACVCRAHICMACIRHACRGECTHVERHRQQPPARSRTSSASAACLSVTSYTSSSSMLFDSSLCATRSFRSARRAVPMNPCALSFSNNLFWSAALAHIYAISTLHARITKGGSMHRVRAEILGCWCRAEG
jgi:hypothetical protein